MKKTLSIFLAVLMVITALPLTAITSFAATSGDFEYSVISEEDKTCEITGYTGTAAELKIPEVIDGYSVTSIGYSAFSDCTSLASITIPDSVTSIDGWAFYNTAYYNDETNWENDVLYIGEYLIEAKETISGDYVVKDGTRTIAGDAFKYCESLENITIPNSVISIGDWAFADCESLTSVTIGNGVTSIGGYAFFYCTLLASITIPDSVTSIDDFAFSYCTSLENITIPDSVTSIGWSAFSDCTSLAKITIPDSVTSIGGWAFYNTAYYNYKTNWENDVLYIREYLIEAKDTISGDYVVKDGTRTIADEAFFSCASLASVTIADSVTFIGDYAFGYCESLNSISIPYSVISMGDYVLNGCYALTNITVSGDNKVYSSVDGVLFNKDKTELIQYPVGNARTSYTIPNTVTSIGENAFSYCTSLEIITIPDSVKYIGGEAFSGCTSLTDVYYTGTEGQWNAIEIGDYNKDLFSAAIHYNYGNPNRTGWVLEGSRWAYYENGTKVTNRWLKDSVGWCYVGADGYCVTNQWKADSKGWCYLDSNGRMVINNWVNDNGKWYFLDANGYMVSNCWKKDSKGWCYLGSSGAMLTNAWVKDSVGWCYVGANGYCVTNKWVKDSHGWCYLDASGRMATNKWIKDSVGWCYVGADGYCVTNAWKADSKGWCYLDSNGRMMTNSWLQWNGNWYYLDENGYMVTGTKVINGKTYKFNSNGVWIG